MRLMWLVMLLLVMVEGVAGCVPKERVVWSPDGTRGLVLGSNGVHVCDVAGNLTGMMIPWEVQEVAAWMPDGKRVLVLRKAELKNWKEIEAVYPEEAAEAKEKADEVIQRIANPDGKWKQFNATDLPRNLTFFYLRDEKPETIKGKLPMEWDDALRLSLERAKVQIYDISGPEAKAGATVAWLPDLDGVFCTFRVSPTGDAVAISRLSGEHRNASETIVAATDGSGIRMRMEAGAHPDWTPDGKYLVYIKPRLSDGQSDGRLGTLARRKIVDDQGVFLKKEIKADDWPVAEDLAGLIFQSETRVRVGKDGRIFFTTLDVKLPMAASDDPEGSIFVVDPGRLATISRVLPRKSQEEVREKGGALAYFELSPDGRWISLPFTDGLVGVLEVGTGQLSMLQEKTVKKPDESKEDQLTIPTWRGVDELTFVRPREDGKGNEVVRYNLTFREATVISGSWSIEVTDGWLDKKE
ncbi:MAG: hypothetical protein FWD53_10765 [Phycisphaerales bacterium]|nr:hypothetical protein [Phycisphaerales bacterium]